jgi:hypothetical protein
MTVGMGPVDELILTWKIVVMVTKSVGDWFGRGGIADQMIRFNGFPFLDKEDKPFNVPGRSPYFVLLWRFANFLIMRVQYPV